MKVFVKKGEVVNGIGSDEWCVCGHQQAVHAEPEDIDTIDKLGAYYCEIHNFDPQDRCDCRMFQPQHPKEDCPRCGMEDYDPRWHDCKEEKL